MPADFAIHQANGVRFVSPLSKLPSGTFFAYMSAPDGGLVEINTHTGRAFAHVHLMSEHPLCAADWYVRHLGQRRGRRRAKVRARFRMRRRRTAGRHPLAGGHRAH